jgi:microcystin-dependent protein
MSTIPNPATTPWVPLWDTGAKPGVAMGSIPGEVKLWPGKTLPDVAKYGKWVWADGASYDVATYPEANTNIAPEWKTAFGAADPGAGKFRVPDMRGMVPAGLDAMPGGARANRTTRATAATIATKSGEEYHALTVAELAAHDHGAVTGTDSPDHAHSTAGATAGHVHYIGSTQGSFGGWQSSVVVRGGDRGTGQYSQVGSGLSYNYMESTYDAGSLINYDSGAHQDHAHNTYGANARHAHSISTQGSGGAHETMQPTVFVPYIVRLDG